MHCDEEQSHIDLTNDEEEINNLSALSNSKDIHKTK